MASKLVSIFSFLLLFLKTYFIFNYVCDGSSVFMCGCPWNPEGFEFPGTGAKGNCELLHGFWKSNLGPLEEQPMFLTFEPSL